MPSATLAATEEAAITATALDWETIDTAEADGHAPPAVASHEPVASAEGDTASTAHAPPAENPTVEAAPAEAPPPDLTTMEPADLSTPVATGVEVSISEDEDLDEAITEAKMAVGDAHLVEKEAAAAHKLAKKALDHAVDELQELVFRRRGVGDESVSAGDSLGDCSTPAGGVAGVGNSQSTADAPDAAACPPDNDEGWREVPISVLRLSRPITEALLNAGLSTIGHLSRFLESKALTDIVKVGEKKAEQIAEALDRFWPKWRDGKIRVPKNPVYGMAAQPSPTPTVAQPATTPASQPPATRPPTDPPEYLAGALAREALIGVGKNPHKVGSTEWADWDRGWQDVNSTSRDEI